jgi:hypothetical protein
MGVLVSADLTTVAAAAVLESPAVMVAVVPGIPPPEVPEVPRLVQLVQLVETALAVAVAVAVLMALREWLFLVSLRPAGPAELAEPVPPGILAAVEQAAGVPWSTVLVALAP